MRGKRRVSNIALARQVSMHILRTELEMPLQKIADLLNKSDHTTVLYACEIVPKKIKSDTALAEKVEKCRGMLFY